MKLSRLDKLFKLKDNVAEQLTAEAVLGFLIKKNMTHGCPVLSRCLREKSDTLHFIDLGLFLIFITFTYSVWVRVHMCHRLEDTYRNLALLG